MTSSSKGIICSECYGILVQDGIVCEDFSKPKLHFVASVISTIQHAGDHCDHKVYFAV